MKVTEKTDRKYRGRNTSIYKQQTVHTGEYIEHIVSIYY